MPEEILEAWDQRWPNFPITEPNLSCSCCGEFYWGPEFYLGLDRLQLVRTETSKPIGFSSVHRCWHYNAIVGGVPLSVHKKAAWDVKIGRHDRHNLLKAMKKASFSTFGLYRTFIHTDIRLNRLWYGHGGKELWNG